MDLVIGGSGGGGGSSDYLSVLTSAEIAITAAATATISRQHLISGTSADYTVALPAASGNTGKFIGIRIDLLANASKLYTIDGNGSEKIDGALTRVMWAGESAMLYCDGSNWFKIAGRSLPMICTIEQLGGNQSIPASTITVITFDTTVIDNTGVMADLANDKILIKRGGIYSLSSGISYDNLTGIATRALQQIRVNNVSQINSDAYGSSGSYPAMQGSKLLQLVATDYSQLIAFQNSISAQDVDGVNGVTFLTALEIPQW